MDSGPIRPPPRSRRKLGPALAVTHPFPPTPVPAKLLGLSPPNPGSADLEFCAEAATAHVARVQTPASLPDVDLMVLDAGARRLKGEESGPVAAPRPLC